MINYTVAEKVERLTGMKPVTDVCVYMGDEVISHVRSILDQLSLSDSDNKYREDGYIASAVAEVHELTSLDEHVVSSIVCLFAYLKSQELAELAKDGSIATCLDIINIKTDNSLSDDVMYAKLNGLSEMEMRFLSQSDTENDVAEDSMETEATPVVDDGILSEEQIIELRTIYVDESLLLNIRLFAKRVAAMSSIVDYDYIDNLDAVITGLLTTEQMNALVYNIGAGMTLVRILEPNEDFMAAMT